ncbi:MAG: SDR family NAD(P)-dependent oxidoreductase, partial [Sphingobium sp.]
MRFEGKTVIVTGGASGIGEATVRRFAAEGASVVVADIRPDAIATLLADIGAERHLGVEVDMLDTAAIDRLIAATLERFGRIDVLVNNAGMGSFGRVTDIDMDHWRQVMAIDVDSVFWASRQTIPHLAITGGSIVNV